jgi:hypothetical protein
MFVCLYVCMFVCLHVCTYMFVHMFGASADVYDVSHGTGWATRAPVAQTLQTVRQTCSRTTDTCLCMFARFPSCGIFTPTRASPLNNELKQQGDGAGETSRTTNYELQGTGWATRAPVAQTLQTVRQTCPCTMATRSCTFARFPSCGIFTPTRTIPVKQQLETTG